MTRMHRSDRPDSDVDEVIVDRLHEITALLGSPRQALASLDDPSLDDILARARRQAEEQSLRPEITDDRRLAIFRALHWIHRTQTERIEARTADTTHSLHEMRSTLDDLQGASTAQLIDQIPARTCRGLGFARAMLSPVRSSVWMPRYLHFEADDSPENAALESFITDSHIPFADAPLESAVAQTRTPLMSTRPGADRRTCRVMIEVSQTAGFVVAPIVARGRAIGILHADRPVDRRISDVDLGLLSAFGECLSVVFERAMIIDRLRLSAARVDELFGDITAELSDINHGTDAAAHTQLDHAPTSVPGRPSSPTETLTARELEVLELVATGATNFQIARCLVVSEETVKSHVKQIARKLGTTTRSGAVARFVQLGGQLPGTYGR